MQLLELNLVKTICFNNEFECGGEDASAVREKSNDSVKEPVYYIERGFRTNLQTPGLLYVMTVLGYKKGELDRPIFVTPKTTHSRDWAML